jgi:hypothetical protein
MPGPLASKEGREENAGPQAADGDFLRARISVTVSMENKNFRHTIVQAQIHYQQVE